MSSRSTGASVQLTRSLLVLHLLLVAGAIAAYWPTLRAGLGGRWDWVWGFWHVAVLTGIGLSSARLAAGRALSLVDWLLHAAWAASMIVSMALGRGPFAFRLEPTSGFGWDFSTLNAVYPMLRALQFAVVVGLISTLPIASSVILGDRLPKTRPSASQLLRRGSMLLFIGGIVSMLALRHSSSLAEGQVGLAAVLVLVAAILPVAYLGASGDLGAARILLCEGWLLGLFKFV